MHRNVTLLSILAGLVVGAGKPVRAWGACPSDQNQFESLKSSASAALAVADAMTQLPAECSTLTRLDDDIYLELAMEDQSRREPGDTSPSHLNFAARRKASELFFKPLRGFEMETEYGQWTPLEFQRTRSWDQGKRLDALGADCQAGLLDQWRDCPHYSLEEIDRLDRVIEEGLALYRDALSGVQDPARKQRIKVKLDAMEGRARLLQVLLAERAMKVRAHHFKFIGRTKLKDFDRYYSNKETQALEQKGVTLFCKHFQQISRQMQCPGNPNTPLKDLIDGRPPFAVFWHGRPPANLPSSVSEMDSSNPVGKMLLGLIHAGDEVALSPELMAPLREAMYRHLTELPRAAMQATENEAQAMGEQAGRLLASIRYAISKKSRIDTKSEEERLLREQQMNGALLGAIKTGIKRGSKAVGPAGALIGLTQDAADVFSQVYQGLRKSEPESEDKNQAQFKEVKDLVLEFNKVVASSKTAEQQTRPGEPYSRPLQNLDLFRQALQSAALEEVSTNYRSQ